MSADTLPALSPIVQISNGDRIAIYREITGFPGYAVGSDGSVWSRRKTGCRRDQMLDRWRRLKPVIRNGYEGVNLCANGGRQLKSVHVIVLEAFVGPRPVSAVSRHLDGDRRNNRLDNLAWGTQLENCQDTLRHGKTTRGERHRHAILTADQVRQIRKMRRSGARTGGRQIARQFGISEGTVSDIFRGKRWAWLQ